MIAQAFRRMAIWVVGCTAFLSVLAMLCMPHLIVLFRFATMGWRSNTPTPVPLPEVMAAGRLAPLPGDAVVEYLERRGSPITAEYHCRFKHTRAGIRDWVGASPGLQYPIRTEGTASGTRYVLRGEPPAQGVDVDVLDDETVVEIVVYFH